MKEILLGIILGIGVGSLIARVIIHEVEIRELQEQIKDNFETDSVQTDCHEITTRILKDLQQNEHVN